MKLTLLDTKTGKTAEVDDRISAWQWAENNWSDDCNRIDYFDDVNETEYRKEIGLEGCHLCLGANRFLVIAPEIIQDEEDAYSLREVNHFYSEELLDKYFPKASVE